MTSDGSNNNNNNNHSHHHKGCSCNHQKVSDMQYGTSLYAHIDKQHIKCLNEATGNSGKQVFKDYEHRLDNTLFVQSDIDGELLFTVYFTAEVVLRSIQIIMNDRYSMPGLVHLWNDRTDTIDFDNVENKKYDQRIHLAFDNECILHYLTTQHKFSDLLILKMLFRKPISATNDEEYEIRINCIILKGDYKQPKSRRAVHAIYEAAANPSDHKNTLKDENKNVTKNLGK